MRIKQMSDLHLEFDADFFPKNEEKADLLMLNGDICMGAYLNKSINSPYHIKSLDFLNFFEFCSNEYENVLYIPGNHEYYKGYIDRTDDTIRNYLSVFPNIHFLNNQKWEKDGITFLGATLWTDMNHNSPITEQYLVTGMNDFRIIRNSQRNYSRFSPLDAVVHHRETLEYIKSVVDSDASKKYVVVGHHAPSSLSIHETYKNDYYMNGGYYSDLSEFILDRPQIALWTHGHMHDPFDYMMGETRIVCNPRGYKGHDPHADYFELKFLEI